MDNQNHTLDDFAFSDLVCLSDEAPQPQWSEASTTFYAHPSGELPSRFAAVGWQPLHLPGRKTQSNVLSRTVQGLARRAHRIVRGEA
ncbi:MAG TPA: hypothetical protein HA356_02765 [Candidatus Poseidoniaceae archaeon]|nr:MAG TPA: hypothetical protein D7H95_02775 [Candidatus Poseidoniales archaeon]HII10982.1 hypothetical protein [Candidatus Poseidoniaceae archaeon]|tara:strand:+ start:383 stop:643 length:261 start_codon:yes stop_codon:yes gene_type:complete